MLQQKSVRVKKREGERKRERKGKEREVRTIRLIRTQIIALWSGEGAVGSSELF